MMSEKDEESKKRQSMFEAKLREMETSRANLTTSGGGPLKNKKNDDVEKFLGQCQSCFIYFYTVFVALETCFCLSKWESHLKVLIKQFYSLNTLATELMNHAL